jgi:hypothetical protein
MSLSKRPIASKRHLVLFTLALSVYYSGCVVTPNYYTGKTLRDGEKIISGGIDNIYIADRESLEKNETQTPFTVSFGFARGFPHRFEAGIRYLPPTLFDTNLRWEVTPDRFTAGDLSLNGHLLTFLPYLVYGKYGLSLSKDIRGFEPLVNYYQYIHVQGLERSFRNERTGAPLYRTVGIGLAIPIPHAQINPGNQLPV